MFCSSCAKELPAGAGSCPACGTAVSEAKKGMSGCKVAVLVGALSSVGCLFLGGFIAAIAIPNLLVAIDRGKQKRTKVDGNRIATMIEMHYEETGEFPRARSVEELNKLTGGDESGLLPTIDGWGNPFVVNSDEAGYEVVSFGKDGVQDRLPTDSYDVDLVWYLEAAPPEEETAVEAPLEGVPTPTEESADGDAPH